MHTEKVELEVGKFGENVSEKLKFKKKTLGAVKYQKRHNDKLLKRGAESFCAAWDINPDWRPHFYTIFLYY